MIWEMCSGVFKMRFVYFVYEVLGALFCSQLKITYLRFAYFLKVFIGNCDHFTPVLNTFNPVTARYVKIIVVKASYPCMRVELYGCDT